MTEQAKQFLEKLSTDEALRGEYAAALEGVESAKQSEAVINFAKSKGVVLTEDDFAREAKAIDDKDLEAVAGGGACACAWTGFGTYDMLKCVCHFSGTGSCTDRGICSQGGCICQAAGAGATRRH